MADIPADLDGSSVAQFFRGTALPATWPLFHVPINTRTWSDLAIWLAPLNGMEYL